MTERFGSKRTWIASIVLFAIGSALCALATSAGEPIAFLVLQGLGVGDREPRGDRPSDRLRADRRRADPRRPVRSAQPARGGERSAGLLLAPQGIGAALMRGAPRRAG